MKEGATPLTAELVREFCAGKLAHYKIPRYVHVVDEFPMTVTGKVRKVQMREEAVRLLASGADNIAVSGEHDGASALSHCNAAAVDVRTLWSARAADHNVVSAVDALATSVHGCEQVVHTGVQVDSRTLNGGAGTLRQGVTGGRRAQGLTRARIQLNHVDAVEEGTESQPPVAGGVADEGWIDGI